jgi:hypothetical protein
VQRWSPPAVSGITPTVRPEGKKRQPRTDPHVGEMGEEWTRLCSRNTGLLWLAGSRQPWSVRPPKPLSSGALEMRLERSGVLLAFEIVFESVPDPDRAGDGRPRFHISRRSALAAVAWAA